MNGRYDEAISGSLDCWKIIHVPEKPPVLPHLQPTVDVLASEIEARHANTLVRKLNHIAPLEGLRHVKRVRKVGLDGGTSQLFVILCMASGTCDEFSCMPEAVKELLKTFQLSTFIAKVSKFAASTKEEWEEQCKLWPTSFHPPTYNIEGITGFSEEESKSVGNFMRMAVTMAKSGTMTVNTAIVVDPSTSEVIASACDQVHSGNEQLKAREPYQSVACLHPWGWHDQVPGSSADSWHPLRHAAINVIDKSAARDRHLYPLNGAHPKPALEHCTSSPLKRQKIDTQAKDEEIHCNKNSQQHGNTARPYLCTGYDIYFVWEPCIMCAMAIVHQRIRRVFFACPNPNNGALGSVYRLQGERSLNHHYAVFQVLLPEEILATEDLH